jgi:hypothetical protein
VHASTVTKALPFTKANLKRRIDAAHEAGLFVTSILPDGTVLTADRRPELIQTHPYEGQDNAQPSKWADVRA